MVILFRIVFEAFKKQFRFNFSYKILKQILLTIQFFVGTVEFDRAGWDTLHASARPPPCAKRPPLLLLPGAVEHPSGVTPALQHVCVQIRQSRTNLSTLGAFTFGRVSGRLHQRVADEAFSVNRAHKDIVGQRRGSVHVHVGAPDVGMHLNDVVVQVPQLRETTPTNMTYVPESRTTFTLGLIKAPHTRHLFV